MVYLCGGSGDGGGGGGGGGGVWGDGVRIKFKGIN